MFELVSNVIKVNSHTDSELLDAVHSVMCYSWFCYICGVFLVFIVILAYLHTHIMVFVRILIKLQDSYSKGKICGLKWFAVERDHIVCSSIYYLGSARLNEFDK